MFLNQPRQSLYPAQYAPNEDAVLQQFYEQRKKRSRNSVKRHSLLQKNSSYFSNSNYQNISQNLTQNSENNQDAVSSHYSSFNNTANINVHPHTSLTGSTNTKDRSYNLSNHTTTHDENKSVTDARNQIKQRSTSITQAQILRKYQDINHHVMSKTMNSHSMGTTAPVTPSTHSTRSNNILMESNKKNVNMNQNTPLCMKSIKQNVTASNTNKCHAGIEEGKQNTQTKYRNTERRKNLQKLQNNFKILTGQLPAYQGEFHENNGKIKNQVMKNPKSIHNEKKSINIDISHENKLNEINPKSSVSTTPKNSRIGMDCISGTENITIINKIRSNKKCEPSITNSGPSNQSTSIKGTKIPPRAESYAQSSLINIKEYLANNSSFCAHQQTSDKCGNEKTSSNYKHDEDEPLLVLANAKHIKKQENENENALSQIYQKYNINRNSNSNSNKNNKMSESGVMKKVITNEESNQQYSQYQDRHDQILIQQECEINNYLPSEQCWQEFQSPNFKMHVENTDKIKVHKYPNRLNTNQSIYPPNQQQSKQINNKKFELLKNYDSLGTSNKQSYKSNLNNSRASKGSITSKTNKKFTNNQAKVAIQTQQKIKQKSTIIQSEKQNRLYKQSLNELHQAEIQKLQARILELEKSNKKQKKFIESVQSMRRTIEKVQDDCNLKDLWRWLKVLPSKI